jgi:hypothetical protein
VKNGTLKSAVAVIAGFSTLAILATTTDSVLEKVGVMKPEPFVENPVLVIAVVILYRTIFAALGCYVAARIAPNKPVQHAMILGIICVVLTIVGLVAMWDIPPRWYPISLIVLTLPAAWLGGKMAIGTRASSISRSS